MRPTALIASIVALSMPASGCLGGASAPSTGRPPAPAPAAPAKQTVQGRVFTTACGGPAAASCTPHNFRGALVFCRTMHQPGLCPSARVNASGRYAIRLRPGRYALIPAPGKGNVVTVAPRWVSVAAGRTTTVNIDGGNVMF